MCLIDFSFSICYPFRILGVSYFDICHRNQRGDVLFVNKKIYPLCEPPRNGIFCGPDKYLKLQEYTVSTEMCPIMEFDSYFILVKKGRGILL